jgi:glycosyltransferase involved in cell wall biosynthesis
MVVLSLPYLESFGLVPLEAMASGAIVVGFHGYGGQEYATAKNGFWFPSDYLEETADAIARVLTGWEKKDPRYARSGTKAWRPSRATARSRPKRRSRNSTARW